MVKFCLLRLFYIIIIAEKSNNLFFSHYLMFEAKEKFLDRMEQSFAIFKANVVPISLPFIIFNFVSIVLIPMIFVMLFLNYMTVERLELLFLDESMYWLYNEIITIIIWAFLVGIVLFIIYLLFLIPIQICTLKSIKQAINKENITPSENLSFWVYKLLSIFKTYWYIFAYVYLIPSLFFITWWVIMIIGLINSESWLTYAYENDITVILGTFLMWLSMFLALFFSIYRWIKSSFAIISAIDKTRFTKNNFISSLRLTQWKWWRIFWNLFWVGFIGGLIVWLITWFVDGMMSVWVNSIDITMIDEDNPSSIVAAVREVLQFNIFSFISRTFWSIVWTLLGIYILVFTYIFFKRLEWESKEGSNNPSNQLTTQEEL